MARRATPLVLAPALPAASRVELLVARARLLHQPLGLDSSEESLLTVLLSFDPSETERRAARVVAASFIAADCSFEGAPPEADLGTWLSKTLQGRPPSMACVVIALPNYDEGAARQVCALVMAVRAGHHQVPLIVGVAEEPAAWACCELDGFVFAEPRQRVCDALRVFSMLAAIMAPGLMCCLDADDFRCALGTAARPSRLAQAVYLAASDRCLPISRNGEQVLRSTSGVAVMPSQSLPLTAQAHLVGLVRALVRPGAVLTVVAPLGLTVEPRRSGDSVEVVLLCR